MIGTDLFQSDNALDSGFIAGAKNLITDSFSRDTHIPFPTLISLLHQHVTTIGHLPQNVVILGENEEDLSSLLQSIVQQLPVPPPRDWEPTRSGLFPGFDGKNCANTSTKPTSSSAMSLMRDTLQNAPFSQRSLNSTDIITLAEKLGFQYENPQLEKLSQKLQHGSRIRV